MSNSQLNGGPWVMTSGLEELTQGCSVVPFPHGWKQLRLLQPNELKTWNPYAVFYRCNAGGFDGRQSKS